MCLLANITMFSKKKKRIEISAPSNFEHRVHTGYDQQEQKFTGLPRQWQGIIEESAKRPKPLVDPVCITAVQSGSQKVDSSSFVLMGYLNCLVEWMYTTKQKTSKAISHTCSVEGRCGLAADPYGIDRQYSLWDTASQNLQVAEK
ncbi:hypothetical protein JD844_006042 [Phrynosoma platyrhinos]|uniref:non-specific serine/threonine protein kinase n=1 Tax=Phrynosoma platyrhinos TaxID=52577 RepID=A0ABQ7TPU6_PHRPL|nr:hypothetical protein JD844_006042 [Phrynosoma platyrhinos]